MSLTIPVPGVDPGPDYADNINASFSILDQHNHAPGNGVQINPNGILINSDLPFGNNNATVLRSSRYQNQPSLISGASDINCLYSGGTGGDAYWNDGSGNQIQLTKAGSVNATTSGIVSGSASASFVANVLVVNAAALTPANIQGASLLLGNNVANTHYLTLSPPNAMAADFTLTLPNIPSVLSFMTLDASGNMGASIPVNTPVNYTQSASSGNFSTTNTGFINVSNVFATLTTVGKPVVLIIAPDASSPSAFQSTGGAMSAQIVNNSTGYIVGTVEIGGATIPGNLIMVDPSVIGAPGIYTWNFQIKANVGGTTAFAQFVKFDAYELSGI